MTTIVRAQVAHTPRDPFLDSSALQVFSDGAVVQVFSDGAMAFDEGRIVACGDFASVRGECPDADVVDARDGTTTALVFGSHLVDAQEALFAAAFEVGLRVASGLVVSDRGLLPSLRVSAADGVAATRRLIGRWHGRGLIRSAVTPRFSVPCSAEMLDACGSLLREMPGLLLTTHLNVRVAGSVL